MKRLSLRHCRCRRAGEGGENLTLFCPLHDASLLRSALIAEREEHRDRLAMHHERRATSSSKLFDVKRELDELRSLLRQMVARDAVIAGLDDVTASRAREAAYGPVVSRGQLWTLTREVPGAEASSTSGVQTMERVRFDPDSAKLEESDERSSDASREDRDEDIEEWLAEDREPFASTFVVVDVIDRRRVNDRDVIARWERLERPSASKPAAFTATRGFTRAARLRSIDGDDPRALGVINALMPLTSDDRCSLDDWSCLPSECTLCRRSLALKVVDRQLGRTCGCRTETWGAPFKTPAEALAALVVLVGGQRRQARR